jgi:hypothetical protein
MKRQTEMDRIHADWTRYLADKRRISDEYENKMDDLIDRRLEILRRWWLAQPVVTCEVKPYGCRKWMPVDLHLALSHGRLHGWTDKDHGCPTIYLDDGVKVLVGVAPLPGVSGPWYRVPFGASVPELAEVPS